MKVAIVDDHTLFRESLRKLLELEGYEVVCEVGSGEEIVSKIDEIKVDLVIMDLKLPGISGVEATRAILAKAPKVKVVVLTAFDDDSDLFDAIKAGACGYILKNIDSSHFIEMLAEAITGKCVFSPEISGKLVEKFRSPRLDQENLTPRELDIIKVMVQGITSTKDIADALHLSPNTVKFHIRNILDKLGVKNRVQIVVEAVKRNLVHID